MIVNNLCPTSPDGSRLTDSTCRTFVGVYDGHNGSGAAEAAAARCCASPCAATLINRRFKQCLTAEMCVGHRHTYFCHHLALRSGCSSAQRSSQEQAQP